MQAIGRDQCGASGGLTRRLEGDGSRQQQTDDGKDESTPATAGLPSPITDLAVRVDFLSRVRLRLPGLKCGV